MNQYPPRNPRVREDHHDRYIFRQPLVQSRDERGRCAQAVPVCGQRCAAGCGTGSPTRWALNVENEAVQVEGGTHRVR